MRKFKQLISIIAEATKTGVARYQAAFRDQRKVEDPFSTAGVYGRPITTYGKVTSQAAALERARETRSKVKAEAEAEGRARGEAKAKQAAEMAARLATATKEATKGTGVKKQIDTLEPGQTIAVDLQDGGFGYVHHAEPRFSGEKSVKYFSKGNNKQAHPIHSVRIQPDHLEITTPRKSGRNVDIAVVGKVNHKDATPIKSGTVDRNGRFVTQHDINR
jgi:hypothetical protein